MHRVLRSGPSCPEEPTVVPARYGYLSPKGAADFTNISVQELERLRRAGGGPKFSRLGARTIRYAVEDLCAWLDSYKVSNTAEALAREGVARG